MSLGDKMKAKEESLRSYLPPKKYFMLRLDGKAFSQFTMRFKKPFDDQFILAMNEVAKYLCSNIQGAKMAFVQSDEISVLFTDKDSEETQMWFQGAVLKIVSVSAALASAKFNQVLPTDSLAIFDSRLLVLENMEEVREYFKWRQEDCIKNSISMVASHHFSHKELHKKSSQEKLSMIESKGDNWSLYPQGQKQGRMISKKSKIMDTINQKTLEPISCLRTYWEAGDAEVLSEANLEALIQVPK